VYDEQEWEETPEARMFRDQAAEDTRWAAYCASRIDGLWRELPKVYAPYPKLPMWAVQHEWKLKRWR
jgi:hypothetical protein